MITPLLNTTDQIDDASISVSTTTTGSKAATELPVEIWQSIINRLEPPSLGPLLLSSKKISKVIHNLSSYWTNQLTKRYPSSPTTRPMTLSFSTDGADQSEAALKSFSRLNKIERKWRKRSFYTVKDHLRSTTTSSSNRKLYMDVCLDNSSAIALYMERPPTLYSPRTSPTCIDLPTQKEVRRLDGGEEDDDDYYGCYEEGSTTTTIPNNQGVSVALFVNQNQVLIGGRDGRLTQHDLRMAKTKTMQKLPIHFGEISEIIPFHTTAIPTSTTTTTTTSIATSSYLDQTVALWDMRMLSRNPLQRYHLDNDRPTCLSSSLPFCSGNTRSESDLLCGTERGDLLNLSKAEKIVISSGTQMDAAINCITPSYGGGSTITIGRMNATIEHIKYNGQQISRQQQKQKTAAAAGAIPLRSHYIPSIDETIVALHDGTILCYKDDQLIDTKHTGMSMLWGLKANEQRVILTSLDVANPIIDIVI